jgi:hypothetical protein
LKDKNKAEKADHDEKGEADIVKKAMDGEVEGKKGYATLSESSVTFEKPSQGIPGGDPSEVLKDYNVKLEIDGNEITASGNEDDLKNYLEDYALSHLEIDSDSVDEETVFWEPENRASTYTFAYPPKPKGVTKVFLDFVFNNPGKTRKDFYTSINRPYSPGNNSMFFASVTQAGLVELVDSKYYIGENYGKWTQGKLKKADYSKPFSDEAGG